MSLEMLDLRGHTVVEEQGGHKVIVRPVKGYEVALLTDSGVMVGLLMLHVEHSVAEMTIMPDPEINPKAFLIWKHAAEVYCKQVGISFVIGWTTRAFANWLLKQCRHDKRVKLSNLTRETEWGVLERVEWNVGG